MDASTVELLLANRSFLYALAARGFAEEMDGEFARILASEHARAEVALVDSDETPAIVDLLDAMAAGLSRAGAVEDAAREYVRLFVGPGTLRANPWETVQLSGKRALFQPGVLDVRDAYRAAGFLPVRVREVPDDFIGIELDFMAKLAAKAYEECAAGDDGWQGALAHSRSFLHEHLLKWIGTFADAVSAEYGDVFYARFSRFVALVAARDAEVLDAVRG